MGVAPFALVVGNVLAASTSRSCGPSSLLPVASTTPSSVSSPLPLIEARGPVALELVAAVVVAELHDHKVAGPKSLQCAVPASFGEERPTAATADRMVLDIDAVGIEVLVEHLPPTPQAAVTAAAAVLDGGIADENQPRLGLGRVHAARSTEQTRCRASGNRTSQVES